MAREQGDTRSALLEAAIEVIEESGESGFRINAVLDRVGVASTAIYHHFGSRDDLVDSANAERYQRTLYALSHDAMVDALAKCTTEAEFDATLAASIVLDNDPATPPRRRTRVAVLGSAVSRPSLAAKITEVNAVYARTMAEVFRPAQERGWIRSDLDLEAVAMWYIGQTTGRVMVELGSPAPVVDLGAWSRVESEAVVAVLKGRPASV